MLGRCAARCWTRRKTQNGYGEFVLSAFSGLLNTESTPCGGTFLASDLYEASK